MSNQDIHTYLCHLEQQDHRCQQQLDQKQNKQLEQSLRKYSFFKNMSSMPPQTINIFQLQVSVFCSRTQITAVPPFRTSELRRVHNSPRRTFTSHMLSLPSPNLSFSTALPSWNEVLATSPRHPKWHHLLWGSAIPLDGLKFYTLLILGVIIVEGGSLLFVLPNWCLLPKKPLFVSEIYTSSYRYLTQPGSRLSSFYFETNSHLSLYEPSCHYLEPQKSQHASPPELLFTVKLRHYLTEVPLIPLSRSFAIWNFFWFPLQPFLANASTPLSEIPEYSIEVTNHLSLQACLQVIFLQHVQSPGAAVSHLWGLPQTGASIHVQAICHNLLEMLSSLKWGCGPS